MYGDGERKRVSGAKSLKYCFIKLLWHISNFNYVMDSIVVHIMTIINVRF